jgi:ribosome-associated protein
MLRVGSIEIPDSEIEFEFARSGGPGGQNVNKVETKVTARFRPSTSSVLTEAQVKRIELMLGPRLTKDGDLTVTSERTRHRERNRKDALQRMSELLLGALRVPKTRRPTRPTRASKERRIEGKKKRGATKRMRKPPRPS